MTPEVENLTELLEELKRQREIGELQKAEVDRMRLQWRKTEEAYGASQSLIWDLEKKILEYTGRKPWNA